MRLQIQKQKKPLGLNRTFSDPISEVGKHYAIFLFRNFRLIELLCSAQVIPIANGAVEIQAQLEFHSKTHNHTLITITNIFGF